MGERIKVTTRARNLGYGWRNDTEEVQDRHGQRHLRIKRVTLPKRVGGLKSVEDEHAYARHIHRGGAFWKNALFVGQQRITGLFPGGEQDYEADPPDPDDFIRLLRDEGSLWVEVS